LRAPAGTGSVAGFNSAFAGAGQFLVIAGLGRSVTGQRTSFEVFHGVSGENMTNGNTFCHCFSFFKVKEQETYKAIKLSSRGGRQPLRTQPQEQLAHPSVWEHQSLHAALQAVRVPSQIPGISWW
jgi:hypothetical protein